MSFDWSEYLDLAEELAGAAPVNTPSAEARQRSAISRAYYAAFHICLAKLGSRIPAYENSHLRVVEYYRHNQNQTYKEIGTRLNRLLADRRLADYQDEIPRLDWLTTKAIANSRQIMS